MVKKIFTLCMNGRGPSQIADQLEKDKILTPTAYKKQARCEKHRTLEPENPYRWHESTIVNILERKEYIGANGQFQDLHQFYLGQEAEGESRRKSSDFLQHPSCHYRAGSL